MFRRYGLVGLIMILLGELFIIFPSFIGNYLFFAFLWYGYILVIDALVYKIKGRSLIMNEKRKFFTLIFLSIAFWWIFEFLNLRIRNWYYVNLMRPKWLTLSIAFSVVWPAVFESFYLLQTIHLFDRIEIRKRNITKKTLLIMEYIGIIMFLLIFIKPKYFFPFTWLAIWFILDPINYLHKKPSIIGYFKKGKLAIPLALAFAGLFTGFFWEFWNYWAPIKWYYDIPFFNKFKIFEMPLLGYLGYLPFGWEVFAMYNFAILLFEEEIKKFFQL
mgnify:CR=1 FL=1